MKTEITVRLLLDATPALTQLAGELISAITHSPRAEQPAEARELPEAPANDEQTAPAEALKDEEPKPAAVSEEPKPAEPTATDVRAAMEEVRQKLEGPDYADRQGDPKAKALHRSLTAAFKNTSALFGADKPSSLAADKRGAFIAEIRNLSVKDDGSIGPSELPF